MKKTRTMWVGRDVGSGYDRGLDVVRHFVKTQDLWELGMYVARVGLNTSKGSGGGKTTMRKVERHRG